VEAVVDSPIRRHLTIDGMGLDTVVGRHTRRGRQGIRMVGTIIVTAGGGLMADMRLRCRLLAPKGMAETAEVEAPTGHRCHQAEDTVRLPGHPVTEDMEQALQVRTRVRDTQLPLVRSLLTEGEGMAATARRLFHRRYRLGRVSRRMGGAHRARMGTCGLRVDIQGIRFILLVERP